MDTMLKFDANATFGVDAIYIYVNELLHKKNCGRQIKVCLNENRSNNRRSYSNRDGVSAFEFCWFYWLFNNFKLILATP